MYRNEETSDSLNNNLERQSLPSFSTIVGMGDRVLVFFISSCVTEVRQLRCRGGVASEQLIRSNTVSHWLLSSNVDKPSVGRQK